MEKLLIIAILGILFISGCVFIEEIRTGEEVITYFEDLNLAELEGQEIVVRGQAYWDINQRAEEMGRHYGLRDSNGFDIFFVPRGDRVLNEWNYYTIKGKVIKGTKAPCFFEKDCTFYYLEEIKP